MTTFPHPVYGRYVLQPAYTDAQMHLFRPMLAAHEAHVVMLAECNIISQANAVAILQAITEIETNGAAALTYQPGIEDLFFRMEGAIMALAGADYGGNLHLGRSRNDLGQALARMALRDWMLALYGDLLVLRQVIGRRAGQFVNTLMPGYAHTQPAQPTTFAHYLAGVLTFLGKDQARLAAAYANVNESPLGAAAFTGTGFPIDRQRLTELLGFDTLIASSQHSVSASDYLTDISFAIQSLAIGLGRMTQHLLFLATQEAGALRLDDSFLQGSSIMPQQRNPVVLTHLRARLGRALGTAQTVAVQCHTIPYGETPELQAEMLPPLHEALTILRECLSLYTAVFETLQLQESHLRQRADAGFITATELADTLVREARLSSRQAHGVVAQLVQQAVQEKIDTAGLTIERLQAIAQAVLGHPLDFSAEQLERALDPQLFINARVDVGGVSPQATTLLIGQLQSALRVDQEWLAATQTRLQIAHALRREAIEMLLLD